MTAATASRYRAANRLAAATPTVLGVLFWIVLPVVCLVMLALGIDHLARHVNNVPAGTPIKMFVSTGPSQVTVPPVVGFSVSKAQSTIAAANLQTSLVWLGWTLTGYQLTQTAVMPLAGKLSESFGRMRVRRIRVCD